MADTLLNKIFRFLGLHAPASATPADTPAVSVASLEARLLLQQRLLHDREQQARQQAAMLADDATAALRQLLDSAPSPPQTLLLDQATASLQAMQSRLGDDRNSGFSLRTLLDQVCLLTSAQASRHDSEIHPLVYDDLPARFHGDPEPLRALLVLMCSHALRSMESGALIIRAMLDDSEPLQDDAPATDNSLQNSANAAHGGRPQAPLQLCISLQRECGAVTVPWGDFPHDCRALAASLDAQLPPSSDDEQRLILTLTPDHQGKEAVLPNPLDTRAVALFHPCAAARASLSYRVRGMNLHSRPVEHLGEIEVERSIALLLALPAGSSDEHTLAVAASLGLPALLVLSDAPRPADLSAKVHWLPAGIDDQRLYQQLQRALRHAAELSPATPPQGNTAEASGSTLQQVFFADLPTTLSNLRACLQRNDRGALKSLTHKLKGGAAYCELPALYQLARRLDQAACCAPVGIIDYLLQRLAMEAESADSGAKRPPP